MKLTATKIKSLPPGKLHCDGNGLYIRLRTPKSGNWSFKYMRGHKSREMGLGPYPEVTLQEARLKRDALKIQLAKGSDPLETKRAKAKEHAKREKMRFSLVAELAFRKVIYILRITNGLYEAGARIFIPRKLRRN